MLVWAIAAFGVVPPLQMRVMRSAAGAPGLASSINIGAFNVGNAIGALVGGAALRLGLGYGAIPWAASALAACALVIVLLPKAYAAIPYNRTDSSTSSSNGIDR